MTNDEFLALVARLLATTVLVPARNPNVIAPIDARSVNDGMTLTNLRLAYRNNMLIIEGPKGGAPKKVNAADMWLEHQTRVTVAGLRLRPDKPEGVYTEDGKQWLNVYHAPKHPEAGGEVDTAIEFFEQLLPDQRERHWFVQSLAFKFLNSGVPGPGVIMVAKEHGTGRGMLAELIKRLFGPTYVKGVSFDIFAGRNYQSQYTDWLADALFVVVNESSVGDGGSVHGARRDTYERLKDLVDPRATMRLIVTKGQPNYEAMCFATFLIFTNHPDALPLPANDRRFAVLTNGQPREQSFWDRVVNWMDKPENIGALARYLRAYNLAGYSPFALPLMTKAKAMMSDLADSDIDRAFATAVASLPGELITQAQIEGAMYDTRTAEGLEFHDRWREVAGRLVKAKLERVGEHRGRNWTVQVGVRRVPVYARTAEVAKRWTEADADEIRTELTKNDPPPKADSVVKPFPFSKRT